MRRLASYVALAGLLIAVAVAPTAPAHAAVSRSLPAVASNLDGRLEVFAFGPTGLEHSWQQNSAPYGWSAWSSLGTPVTGLIHRHVVGTQADGRLDVFVTTENDGAYHIQQTTPGGGWTGWIPLGNYVRPGARAKPPQVASNQDGSLQLFTTDGIDLWTKKQSAPNSATWGAWENLGHTELAGGTPAVELDAQGRLTVLVAAMSGIMIMRRQTVPGGAWGIWGAPDSLTGTPPPTAVKNVALARNIDGRLEAFALGTWAHEDLARLSHAWEVTPGGKWSGWEPVAPDSPHSSHGDLAVVRNNNGRIQTFTASGLAHLDTGRLFTSWQEYPGERFLDAGSVGGDNYYIHFAIGKTSNGRLVAVAVDAGVIHVASQYEAGGSVWSGFVPLDGTTSPPPPPPSFGGTHPVYTITAQHSGQCLDVVDASQVDSARIQQWVCNNANQQKWEAIPAGGSTHYLRSRSSGKCLDVTNANPSDATPLQQWTCNNSPQQKFTLPVPGTWGEIRSAYNRCLDIVAGSNSIGARLQQWTCNGGGNQRFMLTEVAPTPVTAAVYHQMRHAGGMWTGFQPVDLSPVSQVSAAGDSSSGTNLLAVRNGLLWHRYRNASGSWNTWTSSPATPAGTLSASGSTDANNHMQVVHVTADGQIYHAIRDYSNGAWIGPNFLGNPSGTTVSSASIAIDKTRWLSHVTAIANGQLWHRVRNGDGSWTAWGHVPVPTSRRVSTSVDAAGNLHIAMATADGRIFHAMRYANGSWIQPANELGNPAGTTVSSVAIVADPRGHVLHVLAVCNGQIWHRIRADADGSWNAWSIHGNNNAVSVGAAVDATSGLQVIANY